MYKYLYVVWLSLLLTLNPCSTEEPICSVFAASADDVDSAVKAARKAFKDPSWKGLSGTARAGLMTKLANLVGQHAETLATIECLESQLLRCWYRISHWAATKAGVMCSSSTRTASSSSVRSKPDNSSATCG